MWIRSIRDRNGKHRILAESSSPRIRCDAWKETYVSRHDITGSDRWIAVPRAITNVARCWHCLRLISSKISIVNLYSVIPDIILRRVHPATYHFSSISVFHFFVNPHPPYSVLKVLDFSIIFQRDCHIIVDLIKTMITRFEKFFDTSR